MGVFLPILLFYGKIKCYEINICILFHSIFVVHILFCQSEFRSEIYKMGTENSDELYRGVVRLHQNKK